MSVRTLTIEDVTGCMALATCNRARPRNKRWSVTLFAPNAKTPSKRIAGVSRDMARDSILRAARVSMRMDNGPLSGTAGQVGQLERIPTLNSIANI